MLQLHDELVFEVPTQHLATCALDVSSALEAATALEGVPAEVRALAREEGVTLEALPTAPAISTYNILAGEDRRVLGAFLVQPDPAARGDG